MDQTSPSKNLDSDHPTISWPLDRPQETNTTASRIEIREALNGNPETRQPPALPSELLPGQKKSLAGVSLRAFFLGLTLGVSTVATVLLSFYRNPLWRAPFFLSLLSLFHFLEFYITAAHNTRFANISAFLLSQNGYAYNLAHTAAMLECLLTNLLFPTRSWSPIDNRIIILLGFVMVTAGQATRSLAMIEAGSNFNHTVQMRKAAGHELVTSGVYALFRHPSYFGFFWWGVGSQVVLGNIVCFCAYVGILWSFFRSRIMKEEEFLVAFFGKDYEDYRKRTLVWIPFIR